MANENNSNLYKRRLSILKDHFPNDSLLNHIVKIDCQTTVPNIFEKLNIRIKSHTETHDKSHKKRENVYFTLKADFPSYESMKMQNSTCGASTVSFNSYLFVDILFGSKNNFSTTKEFELKNIPLQYSIHGTQFSLLSFISFSSPKIVTKNSIVLGDNFWDAEGNKR